MLPPEGLGVFQEECICCKHGSAKQQIKRECAVTITTKGQNGTKIVVPKGINAYAVYALRQ